MSEIEIIRPGESLSIDPVTSGFAHGFGVFETIALRAGFLEFWDAHWSRLRLSAEHFGLSCDYDQAEVLAAITKLASDLSGEGVIKLSLMKQSSGARLFVYSRPSLFRRPEQVGFLIQKRFPINERSPLAGHKSHNYIESMMAAASAHEAGCYDCVRVNARGEIAEGAISNLFFIVGGQLKTPELASGLLPGVVRSALVDELQVEEVSCSLEELDQAEALYLTNSTVGVLPVDYILQNSARIELDSARHLIFGEIERVWTAKLEAARVQIFA